jgi:hypothetical protein
MGNRAQIPLVAIHKERRTRQNARHTTPGTMLKIPTLVSYPRDFGAIANGGSCCAGRTDSNPSLNRLSNYATEARLQQEDSFRKRAEAALRGLQSSTIDCHRTFGSLKGKETAQEKVSYTPFGDVYDNAPAFIIHGSLKNCTSVLELAELAQSKGFDVSFQYGNFANDIKLNEGFDKSAPVRSHSVRTAQRFLQGHPGCT